MNQGILINPNDVGNKVVEIPAQNVAVRTGDDLSKKDWPDWQHRPPQAVVRPNGIPDHGL